MNTNSKREKDYKFANVPSFILKTYDIVNVRIILTFPKAPLLLDDRCNGIGLRWVEAGSDSNLCRMRV